MFVLESYKCMDEKCGNEWQGTVGPPNYCAKCGGKYCEWTSFDKWDFDLEKGWIRIK